MSSSLITPIHKTISSTKLQSPSRTSRKRTTRLEELKQKDIIVPKDVNKFRHMIEQYYIRESDLEWMLKLRSYQKHMRNKSQSQTISPPNFYEDDFTKFRVKTETENNKNRKYLKINFAKYKHVMRHKFTSNALAQYEATLRSTEMNSRNHKQPWRIENISVKKTLFDTYLPPILNSSKVNLDKIKNEVSRPLIQINLSSICGDKNIRQRKFEPSSEYTARYPSGRLMSEKYNDRYGIKNLNSIKHIMSHDQSNTNTLWEANLRGGYEKKSILKTSEK